jgi:hypothetical protein
LLLASSYLSFAEWILSSGICITLQYIKKWEWVHFRWNWLQDRNDGSLKILVSIG